ncbi:hypothetical protein [Gaetbulibacter sp. PBL-D1]|uniref:hypothetical protein n=1 Tax=Gaetbulibacter sp. PBL-D1 TaxID=3422594 RepID=UPI003D2EA95A
MKKIQFLVVLYFLILSTNLKAQDVRFAVNVKSDISAMADDGFNFGFNVEYQMTLFYFRAGFFAFPDLRGKDYLDITGTPLGFNVHLGEHKKLRLSTGLVLGLIIRDKGPHPLVGNEHYFEWYPNGTSNGVYFGLGGNLLYRTDGKVWDNDIEPYWRYSSSIKMGLTF